MTDDDLTEQARKVCRQLWRTPRTHPDNERLIKTWGVLCAEMNAHGLPDDITPDRNLDIHLTGICHRVIASGLRICLASFSPRRPVA